MPTIMPKSELLRRAVTHVSEMRSEHPDKPLHEHIDDAAMRFNLSPIEAETLTRLFEKTPVSVEDTGK